MAGTMQGFETVYLDDPGSRQTGTFYDKPYEPASGIVRHPLGTYQVMRRYIIHKVNENHMLSLRLFFYSGERAVGKTPDRPPFKVVAYQFRGDHWDVPAPT